MSVRSKRLLKTKANFPLNHFCASIYTSKHQFATSFFSNFSQSLPTVFLVIYHKHTFILSYAHTYHNHIIL